MPLIVLLLASFSDERSSVQDEKTIYGRGVYGDYPPSV